MPAPEDAVAAGLADRVQVPVPGAPLGAEGGVGVLAAGAALATPTAGSTSAEVERLPGPEAGPPGAASGGWWSKRPAARGKGF